MKKVALRILAISLFAAAGFAMLPEIKISVAQPEAKACNRATGEAC